MENAKGIDVNILGQLDGHVLHYACDKGHLEFVKYMFENQGLNIDFNVVDSIRQTPLHAACLYGKSDVVEFLLKTENIEIGMKDNLQRTAKDLASQNGHQDILELFKKMAPEPMWQKFRICAFLKNMIQKIKLKLGIN